jgi:chaperonin GroES
MKQLNALPDYMIVRPIVGETTSPSGIVIASGANAKREAMRGAVLAVGPGRVADDGYTIHPMIVSVGDEVLFDNNRAQAFSHDNEVLQLMRQDCVFARVSD